MVDIEEFYRKLQGVLDGKSGKDIIFGDQSAKGRGKSSLHDRPRNNSEWYEASDLLFVVSLCYNNYCLFVMYFQIPPHKSWKDQ